MTTELDDRIRSFVRRIDDLAPVAPDFEELLGRGFRTGATAEHARPRRLVLPLVAGAIALTIALLIVVTRRPEAVPAVQLTRHSIVDELPAGWAALGADDARRPIDQPPDSGDVAVYATAALPLGAVVAIIPRDFSMLDADQPVSRYSLADGRDVVTGASIGVGRWAEVELADGRWIGLLARGIDDDALVQLAGQVVVDDTGARFAGPLPESLRLEDPAYILFGVSPIVFGPEVDPASWRPAGLSMSTYGPGDGPVDTYISIFPVTDDTLVRLALTHEVSRHPDGGFVARMRGDLVTSLYRERDGFAIWATSYSLDADALSPMVDSLRPVADAEWAALASQGTRSRDTPAPEATEGPVPTAAEVTPEPTPDDPGGTASEVTITYRVTRDGPATSAVASLPDQDALELDLRQTGRILSVVAKLGGLTIDVPDLDINRTPRQGGGGGGIVGDGDGAYVFAFTGFDFDVSMIVTDGPTKYTTSYVDLAGSGTPIAVIVVPPRAGRTAPPRGQRITTDGSIGDL